MANTENGEHQGNDSAKDSKPAPIDQIVETKHSIMMNGQLIHYTVAAGTIVLKEETEKQGEKAGEYGEYDPSMAIIMGPFTAAFYDYVRGDLNFQSDLPYEILSYKVNEQWSFGEHENQYVNVAETLRTALSINPFLKVYVANGSYDLATPYFATVYTFNHLGLDPSLKGMSQCAATRPAI